MSYENVPKARMRFYSSWTTKKARLRALGYGLTMTLYGSCFQDGMIRPKRIEVLFKTTLPSGERNKIGQVHNALLYEVFVRQDMNNPRVQYFHRTYTQVFSTAKHLGIPTQDYLVLTYGELKNGALWDEKTKTYSIPWGSTPGQWIEYDQVT